MPVQMNVISHQLVGAYLSKISAAGATRPATVEAFLTALAEFANDALGVEAMQAAYTEATRSWRIPGVIEMFDIDRDAAAEYVTHTAQKVVVRLPDPELLAESRNLAVAFDAGRRPGQFYVDRFYYDYIKNGDNAPSNNDFLDSRIADYTFASCR
jgi:hypothetical protein